METRQCALTGLLLLRPRRFVEERGSFAEIYQKERYREAGIVQEFVQQNLVYSKQRVLRGMHWQEERPQAKLVSCLAGEIFDVVIDLRENSPTFGVVEGVVLSRENGWQFFVPEGFAHGYFVQSPEAIVLYQVTDFYHPKGERGIRWDDPSFSIPWPCKDPLLSEKDRAYPLWEGA